MRLILALPLIVLGGAAGVNSYRQWEGNERRLRLGLPLSYSPVARIVAVGILVVGLAAGIPAIVDVVTR